MPEAYRCDKAGHSETLSCLESDEVKLRADYINLTIIYSLTSAYQGCDTGNITLAESRYRRLRQVCFCAETHKLRTSHVCASVGPEALRLAYFDSL